MVERRRLERGADVRGRHRHDGHAPDLVGRDPREPEPFFLREPLLPEEWAVVQEVREEEGAAAEFEPLRLRNGYDWFYRPVVRKYCTMRDYIDGVFDLVDIADMNDLIAYLRASRQAGPPYRPFR